MTLESLEPAAALLALVAAEPGISLPRAAKRLRASQSQLRRWLAALGPDGAGLLQMDETAVPARLRPSAAALATLSGVAGLTVFAAERTREDSVEAGVECLAEERAIALLYNGIAHAVMLATPMDLEDFAVGFSLSEGIVEQVQDVGWVEQRTQAEGISLQLKIPSDAFEALVTRQRGMSGRSGCGLCGTSALESAIRPVRVLEPAERARIVDLRLLPAAFRELARRQRLNAQCGALHAAAALAPDGSVLAVREDVGRHNALDKVLGASARAGQPVGAVLLTSRASYELVHKAAQCGVPLLASISGPSALAVRTATQAGLTLLGYARDGRHTLYRAVDPSPRPA